MPLPEYYDLDIYILVLWSTFLITLYMPLPEHNDLSVYILESTILITLDMPLPEYYDLSVIYQYFDQLFLSP